MKLLALLALTLLLASCVSQREVIQKQYQAFDMIFTSQWGPKENWTAEQRDEYRRALLQFYAQQTAQIDQQYAPPPLTQPQFGPTTMPASQYPQQPPASSGGLGFRSWHNSDGTSGQYVPNPGGNGGTIFNSDGSTTNVDPAIGH